MAPTLPAELIKLILELVYEDVPPVHALTLLETWDSADDAPFVFAFRPFLSVSKAFHALALPFFARDLATYNSAKHSPQSYELISKYDLGGAVQILALPSGLSTPEQQQMLNACRNVHTLCLKYTLISTVHLPSNITSLHLKHFPYFDRYAASTLADALPHLERLLLIELDNVLYHSPPVPTRWKLKELVLHAVPLTLEEQALSWIADSSASLQLLSITKKSILSWQPPSDSEISPSSIVSGISCILPSLRWLSLGEGASLPAGCEALDERMLPSLEVLELTVDAESAEQLLDLTLSVKRVFLTITKEGVDVTKDSAIVQVLQHFVETHPALEIFSIDVNDGVRPETHYGDDHSADPVEHEWADELKSTCTRLGIVFASNDPGAWGTVGAISEERSASCLGSERACFCNTLGGYQDWGHGQPSRYDVPLQDRCICRGDYWWSSDGSHSAISTDDSDPPFDFDAEDNEQWAHLWSEEKRVAMGLVAKLEEETAADREESVDEHEKTTAETTDSLST